MMISVGQEDKSLCTVIEFVDGSNKATEQSQQQGSGAFVYGVYDKRFGKATEQSQQQSSRTIEVWQSDGAKPTTKKADG